MTKPTEAIFTPNLYSSLTSTLYIDSMAIPSSSLTSTTEKEDALRWLMQGDRLPLGAQANFKIQIQKWADSLSAHIAHIRAKKSESYAIRCEINQCIQDFNTSARLLFSSYASYEQKKIEDDEHNRAIAVKIRSTTINTTPFAPKRKISLAPPPDPIDEFNEASAGMRIVADILGSAGSAVVDIFKAVQNIDPEKEKEQISWCPLAPPNDPIDELKEAAIGVHAVATVIDATFDGAVEMIKAVLKEPVQYVRSCDGSSLVPVLKDNGIPEQEAKAMAKQFIQDITFGLAVPAPAVGLDVDAKKETSLPVREISKSVAPIKYIPESLEDPNDVKEGMRIVADALGTAGKAVFDILKEVRNIDPEKEKKLISKCPLAAPNDPIDELKEAACGVHGYATAINVTGHAAVETLKAVLKEPVQYVLSCDGSSLVPVLKDNGIPEQEAKAMAKQFVQDTMTIGLVAAPIPLVGIGAKKGAVGLGKKAARTLTRISEPKPPFEISSKGPFFQLALTHKDIGVLSKPDQTLGILKLVNRKLAVMIDSLPESPEFSVFRMMNHLMDKARIHYAEVLSFKAFSRNPKVTQIFLRRYEKFIVERIDKRIGDLDFCSFKLEIPVAPAENVVKKATNAPKNTYCAENIRDAVLSEKNPSTAAASHAQLTAKARTLTPEETGLSSQIFKENPKNIHQITASLHDERMVVNVNKLELPKKEISFFKAISSLMNLAKENGAKILEVNVRLNDQKFINTLMERYGKNLTHIKHFDRNNALKYKFEFTLEPSNSVQPLSTKRRPLLAEDLGLPRQYIKPASLELQPLGLVGWIKKGEGALRVRLDYLKIPPGETFNWFSAITRLKAIAKEHRSSILEFEIPSIPGITEEFERALTKRYGAPTKEMRFPIGGQKEYCVYKIPVIKGAFVPLKQDVPSLVQDVYRKISKHPETTKLTDALEAAEDEVLKAIPDFSHLGKKSEEIWFSAIGKGSQDAATLNIHYFKPLSDKEVVARIGSFVIKDSAHSSKIIREIMGCDFLKSLELKHLQTPSGVAVGKYKKGYQERLFIVKTYVPGNTLGDMMKEIGKHSIQSSERHSLYEEFERAIYQTGKAFGELHSKGIKQEKIASIKDMIKFRIAEFEETLESTNDALFWASVPRIKMDSAHLKFVAREFTKAPGELSFGFGNDVVLDQFTWRNSSLGFVDAEWIAECVSRLKQPLAFATEEFSIFSSILIEEGLPYGLSFPEIYALDEAFKQGYFSEFIGNMSKESEHFFNFHASMQIIREFAHHNVIDKSTLTSLVKDLNSKIKLHKKTYQTTANPQFSEAVKKILSPLEKETRLSLALEGNAENIYKIIPDLSHLHLGREELWLKSIQKRNLNSPTNPKIQILPNSDRLIAKIETIPNYIIKDAAEGGDHIRLLNEAMGAKFFESLSLKNLKTPALVAIRRYENGEGLFVVKTYVPGNPYEMFFEKIGRLPAGTPERELLMIKFSKSSYSLGKGIGEVHSKGLEYKLIPPAKDVERDILILENLFDKINEVVGPYDLKIEKDSPYFRSLCEKYQENPGYVSHVIGDMDASNFTWSKKYGSVGLVDTETATCNLNLSMKPMSFTAHEFGDCMLMFDKEGIVHGLSPKEIAILKESFIKGYDAAFSGQPAIYANHFYDVFNTADWVLVDVREIVANGVVDRGLLTKDIELINNKIHLATVDTSLRQTSKPEPALSSIKENVPIEPIKYLNPLSYEEALVQKLKIKLPAIASEGFPKNSQHIPLSDYLKHPVNNSKMKGTLLFKRMGDRLLYIHRTKFQDKILISAYAKKRPQYILLAALDYAKKNNISKIYFAWDHTIQTVASVFEGLSVPISGIGTLPTARFSKVLTVAEIPVEAALGLLQKTLAKADKAVSKEGTALPKIEKPRIRKSFLHEEEILQRLKKELPDLVLPEEFPKDYHPHHVGEYKITIDNSTIKGTLGSIRMGDDLLYIHRPKFHNEVFIKELSGSSSKKKLQYIFEAVVDYAQENNISTLFFGWDHNMYPVASLLESLSVPMTNIGALPKRGFVDSITVVEIPVEDAFKVLSKSV